MLEADLGVPLLLRGNRGIRLTWAGEIFLEDARRVLLAFDQAQARTRAAAAGYQGTLRVALPSDIGRSRLSALLALSREETPEVNIRLFEVPIPELQHGLRNGQFDVGLATIGRLDEEIIATPIWSDPLVVALPSLHPLLAFKEVPAQQVLGYPLILCDPQVCESYNHQRNRVFQLLGDQPSTVEYVSSHALMLTLVAAGYGVGILSAAQLEDRQHADVVSRPLADAAASVTTYLLRPGGETVESLKQFIDRAERIGRMNADL